MTTRFFAQTVRNNPARFEQAREVFSASELGASVEASHGLGLDLAKVKIAVDSPQDQTRLAAMLSCGSVGEQQNALRTIVDSDATSITNADLHLLIIRAAGEKPTRNLAERALKKMRASDNLYFRQGVHELAASGSEHAKACVLDLEKAATTAAESEHRLDRLLSLLQTVEAAGPEKDAALEELKAFKASKDYFTAEPGDSPMRELWERLGPTGQRLEDGKVHLPAGDRFGEGTALRAETLHNQICDKLTAAHPDRSNDWKWKTARAIRTHVMQRDGHLVQWEPAALGKGPSTASFLEAWGLTPGLLNHDIDRSRS